MNAAAVGSVEVRPKKIRRVAIPVAVVLVVTFAVVGTLLRNTPTGVTFQVSDQVSMAVLGLLLAAGVMLLTRPRMRADSAGIEVRNIIGTQRYRWELVQAVSFPDGAPWARLELPEDEYVPIMAIQATDGAHAVAAMRELRELRRRLDAEQD
ncbi:PH (Pleckstrin Homology) domain-containing protein [Saccharopolyspora erythraea NRRL 2338]|uniref:Possible membrane protein n=2 Tax=Saccharopolyspora erythraea TaxID=1836 RepID=A4FBK6_SACEN|nr:PH domain-containing protein [Saccharopolyspora erythraea]EQD81564.1 membrane protein [Saccharopolyspora erythraea D]PFG95211.1 PH (Pleckstrin Homology) domain-containing protein [Saccharopolyspora erythraea NRRL 2338]QRK91869.1 PH domain-containing protein [Saccharopolyspora erythraea]CAM01431.1 possible membrane protein [Saccharopolyspora erythraea NRRL 2338]